MTAATKNDPQTGLTSALSTPLTVQRSLFRRRLGSPRDVGKQRNLQFVLQTTVRRGLHTTPHSAGAIPLNISARGKVEARGKRNLRTER